MGELWSILLLVLGVATVFAIVKLAIGNKPWSRNSVEPSSPPADAESEGMRVMEPGEISPGAPDKNDSS